LIFRSASGGTAAWPKNGSASQLDGVATLLREKFSDAADEPLFQKKLRHSGGELGGPAEFGFPSVMRMDQTTQHG